MMYIYEYLFKPFTVMFSYSTYTDSELISLLSEKNTRAFEEIYRRYWHSLFLHAYHILDDESMAKDTVQELFLDFWHKPSVIHTSLKSYLYTAVRNRVLNKIRRHKTNHEFIQLLAKESSVVSSTSITDILEYKDLVELIDKEVELLPPRMRQVFEMSRKEFMSHKQIAESLGTSEETVKKQISNSLKFLRTRLDKHLFFIVLIELMQRH